MKESALDIYKRTRDIFFKSIVDNVGKADAAAEYYFSSLSLLRHGISIPVGDIDHSLQTMIGPILKEEEQEPIPYPGRDDPGAPVEGLESSGTGWSPQSAVGGGIYGVTQPEAMSGMGHTWFGLTQTPKPEEVGRGGLGVNMLHSGEGTYLGTNPLSSEEHPLMQMRHLPYFGKVPTFIERLINFYLPEKHGVPSQAELDSEKDKAWERHHMTTLDANGNPHFILQPAHLGTSEHTQYDKYRLHFQNWRNNNPDLDEAFGYPTPESPDFHHLQTAHMEDLVKGWMSSEKDQGGHTMGLGDDDYHFGLELESPADRSKIYEHMRTHGTDEAHAQSVHTDLGHHEMGRIKRNNWARFGALYDWWGRDADMTGENIEATQIPEGSAEIKPDTLALALKNDNLDKMLAHHHNFQTGQGRKHLPVWHKKEQRWEMPHKKQRSISFSTLHMLAGYNPETKQLYPADEHPAYPHWDPEDSPIELKDYEKFLEGLDGFASDIYQGRRGRGAAQFHRSQHISPDHHPEEYHQGDNTTKATHWGDPYRSIGGLGRPHDALLDIYHDSHIYDREGAKSHSIYGTKVHSDFEEAVDEASDNDWLYSQLNKNQVFPHMRLDESYGGGYEKMYSPPINTAALFAPFSPLSLERLRFMKRGESHGKAYEKEKVKYLQPAPSQMYSPHNTTMETAVKGAKGDFRTSAATFDGPPHNHMSKRFHNEYMDKSKDESIGPLRRGEWQGESGSGRGTSVRATYSNLRNPHTRKSDLFGVGGPIQQPANISHSIATQGGLHHPPLDPQESLWIPYEGVGGPDTALSTDSLQNWRNLIGADRLTPEEKGGRYMERRLASDIQSDLSSVTDALDKLKGLEEKGLAIDSKLQRYLQQKLEELEGEAESESKISTLVEEANRAAELAAILRHDFDMSDDPEERESIRPYLQQQEALQQRLKLELDDAYEPELGRQSPHWSKEQSLNSRDKKYTEDLKVKADMVGKLIKEAEEQGIPIFTGDFNTDVANIQALSEHATNHLNGNSHNVHNMMGHGLAERETYRPAMGGGGLHQKLRSLVDGGVNKLSMNHHDDAYRDALGLDSDDAHHDALLDAVKGQIQHLTYLSGGDHNMAFPIMKVADMLGEHGMASIFGERHPSSPLEGDLIQNVHEYHDNLRYGGKGSAKYIGAIDDENRLKAPIRATSQLAHILEGQDDALANVGLYRVGAPHRHPEHNFETNIKRRLGGSKKVRGKVAGDYDKFNTIQRLESILIGDPHTAPEVRDKFGTKMFTEGPVPIGDAGKPHGHSVSSILNSPAIRMDHGWKRRPTIRPVMGKDGHTHWENVPDGYERNLATLSKAFYRQALKGKGEDFVKNFLSQFGNHHYSGGIPVDEMPHQMRQHTVTGLSPKEEDIYSVTKSKYSLASLTNSDILLKFNSERPPPLQPMHRIFELDDLEHIRGFTGDWVVSTMPEGERHFIRREGDKVKAWKSVDGSLVTLGEDIIESLKKTTDKDFFIDTIHVNDECYVFDIIEYDDKDVHDQPSQDRLKILRGGMESHEKVLLPGAYNTRFTDDAGLESTVGDLEQEDKRILLRDAKSTYMLGEKRHPKWVLLKPGKDVNLIVLDKKGESTYTYRLGMGPINDGEKVGDRKVELDGENYMDVGTVFHSPKEFNVGDSVEVNVDSVTSYEQNDTTIYTIHAGSIKDEAEGEPLASRETLETFTKSYPEMWPHHITRSDRHIMINFQQGDVIYKATNSGSSWFVHSPSSESNLLIRMAESQRPYWSPLAGVVLKGDLDIQDEKEKAEVKESEGDAKPLIPPKKIEGTDYWDKVVEALKTVEKGIGTVGGGFTGAKGLGIDMATPIESPTGPTQTRDQSTLPDYDGRPRPEEDPEPPRKTTADKPQSIDLPLETEEEVGTLHVDETSAVIHTS
mgnify:CR=1 FL=1